MSGVKASGSAAAHHDVWQALAEIEDPELPIAITDMGLVYRVQIEGGVARIELLPTFVGCPALAVIQDRVRRRLLAVSGIDAAEVVFRFEPAWTVDRMTDEGRARLRAHGMSVPRLRLAEPAVCPVCGSTNTVLENPFGPTLCRAIYYCLDCRNPIERFKPPGDALPLTGR